MGERGTNGKGLLGHYDDFGIHPEQKGKYWRTLSKGIICSDMFFLSQNFLKIFIHLERDRELKWGWRGRGRSKLPFEQGAQPGAQSQDPEIMI